MNLVPAEIAGPKTMQFRLFTIGHSTHPLDGFLKLLARRSGVSSEATRIQPLIRRKARFRATVRPTETRIEPSQPSLLK
jgi:hypothetical protein